MAETSIIAKAEDFFYFEDSLCDEIEKWARKYCSTFTIADGTKVEQPLEHFAIYNDYKLLFEELIERFLRSEGISIGDFYGAVRQEQESAKSHRLETSTFSFMLMSSLEFDSFCELMNGVREGRGVVFCPPLVDVNDDLGDQKVDHADHKEASSCGADSKQHGQHKFEDDILDYKTHK